MFAWGISEQQERFNNATTGGLRRREDELRALNCTAVIGSSDSGTINGAQFVFTTPQPTGTGVIQPFLRLENSPVEQGYNTSGGTPFDDKAGPWTHDLTFGDLQNTQGTLGGAS